MLCRMNCVGTIAAWASLSGCSSIFLAPGYQAIHFLRHVLDELQGFLIELEIFMKGAAIRRSRPIAAHEQYRGRERSLRTHEQISKDERVGVKSKPLRQESVPQEPHHKESGRSEEHTSELQSRLHLVC